MRKLKNRSFPGTRSTEVSARENTNASLARRAAAEGIVLLKNEGGFLPLPAGKAVALYGIGASHTVKGGTGSGDVNERKSVSIYEGMKNAGFTVTTEEWIRDYDAQFQAARNAWRDDILEKTAGLDGLGGFFSVYTTTPFVMPAGRPVEKTDTDTAFYILSRVAGEGADRRYAPGDYLLTDAEEKQLSDLCALYENVVVAVNAGGMTDLSFMDRYQNIRSLLYIVQPGMEGGNAFADVVSGSVTPSGRLTDSWALRYSDYPNSETFSHNNGNVEKEYYTEGIYVGYRYFDTFDVPVRYSFGYGLSYTSFETEDISACYDAENRCIVMRAKVTNTGDTYSGREVVQFYATCPAGDLEKEYRRLVGFGKTKLLAPGESQRMEVRIPLYLLASYSSAAPGWIMECGPYVFWAGSSLEAAAPAAVMDLSSDLLLIRTQNICPLKDALTEILPDEDRFCARLDALMEQARTLDLPHFELDYESFETEETVYKENRALVPADAFAFTEKLRTDQLIALSCGDPGKAQGGNLGAAGSAVPGSAGETSSCALAENLAPIVLADGPAGLRLTRDYNVYEGRILSKPFEYNLEGGLFLRNPAPEPGDTYYQYCTAIPVGTLLAQTWDCSLMEEVGAMIGGEMEEFGVTLWLAPGMNIHRNPLCGRNFEYYSEDPMLSGRMAAAITKGVQSVPGCGTTIKHFACNNQEDNRMDSDSIVAERTLREIYLKGFEIAIRESHPMSLMTSYNLINGVHAANNPDLCTKAARCEWGFDGVIMTDWTTTMKGEDCTSDGCMRAGNDLVMPGAPIDAENIRKALSDGSLDITDLKACVSRLVSVIFRSNQYEPQTGTPGIQ